MRATRAYIASAGTAAVMLGAAISLFALLSAFIAFGSWPGADSNASVDQIVLKAAQKHDARPVTVRRDAVAIARRQAAHDRAVALAKHESTGIVRVPSTTTAGGEQVASAPTGGARGGSGQTTSQVTKQVQDTTKQVQDTTQQVTKQVQDTTQQVQDTSGQVQTQVEQVINGVGGTVDNTTTGAGNTVQQVQDAAGGVLGH